MNLKKVLDFSENSKFLVCRLVTCLLLLPLNFVLQKCSCAQYNSFCKTNQSDKLIFVSITLIDSLGKPNNSLGPPAKR